MDKKALSFLVLGLLLGGLFASVLFSLTANLRTGEAGTRRVLKLAHTLPPASPVHRAMEYMAERLAEISGDQMEIQVFPSAQLGTETETIEQVQRGALALVKTSTAPLEGFIPEMAVFSMPYLFRDEDHYWEVLLGEIGTELLEKGTKVGVRGICYYDSGARSFYTVSGPVLTPDDLAGLKIRTMRSKTAMDMIDTMGGSATPIPFGELYTALQQGMVDGAENNAPSVYDSRHWEVAKHYSLDEHSRIPDIVIISEMIWETLSEEERFWLMQASQESVDYQRKIWKEYVEECMVRLQEEGNVQIYYPDKGPFQAAVAPMLLEYEGTAVGELIKRIQEVE